MEENQEKTPTRASYESIRESIDSTRRRIEEENAIIKEILTRKRVYKDERDDSKHPSFTEFKVPYHMTCRMRYSHKKQEYENQFQYELRQLLSHQPTAYDAARFNRHLCRTTLWPPLHNRKEIEYFHNNFFKLTHKQKKRLEILMNTEVT